MTLVLDPIRASVVSRRPLRLRLEFGASDLFEDARAKRRAAELVGHRVILEGEEEVLGAEVVAGDANEGTIDVVTQGLPLLLNLEPGRRVTVKPTKLGGGSR